MACPGADVFHQLVEGTLAHADRESVADHAGSCDECRAVLGALLDVEPVQIDRYTIVKRIGAGAMGTVYEAHDPELDRKVAIKVLRGAGSPERLRREAQMLAKLHHPNVVAVYDAGAYEGRTFVAMALVDGDNLRTWLACERSVDDIVRVIREAGRGLAAAHAAGVIHRDLKPDNIFVAHDGSVLVGDFGLAFVDGERGTPAGADGPLELTQTGMVLGTPAYMAPEQAAGEPTAASDQFSLCVTAWEALYGARPFKGTTFGEVQQAIERAELVAGKRAVPARVRTALERGLRAKPEERWGSLAELEAALAPPRRRWPWIAAAAVVLVAGGGAFAFALAQRGPSCVFELGDVALGSAAASYEHDWIALRTEVCRAPRPNDARLRCLERAHTAMKELASDAGSNAAYLVHHAIASLPRLAECRDALDGDVPQTTLVAGEVLQGRIESATIRAQLGGNAKLDELRALDAEATKLDFEPAIAAVTLSEGDALSRTGQVDEAMRVLSRGLARAEAAHDDRAVAHLVAVLAPVSTHAHKLDEAATLLQLGDGALVRAGSDPDSEVALASARAELASAAGDHDAAIAIARDTLAKVRARPGDTLEEQYGLGLLLAEELNAAGKVAEGADVLHQISALESQITGGNVDLMKIARECNEATMRGEVARGLELAQQEVGLAAATHDSGLQVEAAYMLARAYDFAHDNAKAIEAYRHALELAGGDKATAAQRADSYEGMGTAHLELGDLARATELLRIGLAAAAEGGHPLDDTRWRCVIALGRALLATGHAHDARVMVEPVQHEIVNDPAAVPHRRASAELVLAEALWEDGGATDRAHARVLAADAEKDFEAGLERLKTWPPALTSSIRARLAETVEWRKRHP